jgi:hypothetical protein
MISPLLGSEPKTAFAGWFRTSDTDFYDTLKSVKKLAMGLEDSVPIVDRYVTSNIRSTV